MRRFSFVKNGDIIFFDYPSESKDNPYGNWEHVGVIYQDSGVNDIPDGVLNQYDQILHAGPKEPHISFLNDKGFVSEEPTAIIICRWKK